MNVRYRVDLSQSERDALSALMSGGKLPARRLKRMQILLAADAGVSMAAARASTKAGSLLMGEAPMWAPAIDTSGSVI